mmetsp:Transcript_45101/g.104501  ORF Transcript_45101/g.104501 Transcript_45101/m.104501 type:complete len:223 (+) Transcript_45101:571-1239(+)
MSRTSQASSAAGCQTRRGQSRSKRRLPRAQTRALTLASLVGAIVHPTRLRIERPTLSTKQGDPILGSQMSAHHFFEQVASDKLQQRTLRKPACPRSIPPRDLLPTRALPSTHTRRRADCRTSSSKQPSPSTRRSSEPIEPSTFARSSVANPAIAGWLAVSLDLVHLQRVSPDPGPNHFGGQRLSPALINTLARPERHSAVRGLPAPRCCLGRSSCLIHRPCP